MTLTAFRINEISTDPNPDWVEFINTGSTAIDVGGWTVTDGGGGVYTFPSPTTVQPGALHTVDMAADGGFAFGLSSNDSITMKNGTTTVDFHSWNVHQATTGRCPGSTAFVVMTATKNAANACTGDGGTG